MRHKGSSDRVAVDTIYIVFLRSAFSGKNRLHWIVHVPSRAGQSFGKFYPHASRATGLPVDVIADVITAMSALADVTCLRHRQSAY